MELFLKLLLLNCTGMLVLGLIYPGPKREGRRPARLGVFATRAIVLALAYGLNARYAPANIPDSFQAAQIVTEFVEQPEVVPDEPAQPETEPAFSGGMVVAYQDVSDPGLAEWQDWARERRMLEQFADWTNEWIRIPTRVTLTFSECGHANAYYRGEYQQIDMCLEELAHIRDQLEYQVAPEQLGGAINGAAYFLLSHELGHALVHTLHLPVTGREEDAVDQLAAYVMLDGSEKGRNAALFWAMSLPPEPDITLYRWYNVLCWIYGQDPQANAHLVTSGMLPVNRARRCPNEYAQLRNSWERLLSVHASPES